ncbi:AAA family ATPase [Streptomyces sp. MI02-2A]|uniref:phosphatase domain-containing protein n=1 Tax=Streptomyces sp. MI02-2A TaxID=3028688 RepID=UPI0029A0E29B|nr:AAA family ATPase [Streptomyces sp. MI02-2A]MDX3260801.1 AAA family ATPase [Streptomyces sp. MI02-2A]
MKLCLIMTKGLPGSGKSTWAKKTVANNKPGTMVRVNKDDLRGMLHDGVWHGKNEKQVIAARDELVSLFLDRGVSVIVDDTNLNPQHERNLRDLAERYDAEFKVADHTSVPLNTCIKRDLQRHKSVGEAVIRDMYEKYLAPKPATPPPYDEDLPNVVLVDIDGTTADMGDRNPFAWHLVGEDAPQRDVIDLVNVVWEGGAHVHFISGRDGSCRGETREWLARHVGEWARTTPLSMRPAGDTRKDAVVKEEIYRSEVLGKYNVWFVLDDRDQVVQMWRGLGLRVLQVAPGNF